MAGSVQQEATRNLASVQCGQRVQIERMLFGMVRDYCYDVDIHEGDIIRCVSWHNGPLLFENNIGRVVRVDLEWSRFIKVKDVD
jgi:hypothetical protein